MRIIKHIGWLPSPEKRLFWFCFLLFLKFGLLGFLISEERISLLPETIAVCTGDCPSYLDPVDNLVTNGTYDPDDRMPGYAFPYYFFRLIASKNIAVNLLIIFQTLLDAVASFLLAIMLYKVLRWKPAFYLAIILYGISVTVSCYNNWILTESLTSSALILGMYFIYRYTEQGKKIFLSAAGLFFTWAYFLRPVNFLILFLAAGVIFLFLSNRKRISSTLAFLLPAILINSLWVIHNYQTHRKYYLLTEKLYIKDWYGEHGIAAFEFCKAFSDLKITYNFFEPKALTYFGQAYQRYTLEDIKIPDEIYTADFNYDSLVAVQKLFAEIGEPGISKERYSMLEDTISKKLYRYKASIIRNHPYIYYVKTPLLLLKSFVLQGGVHNLYFMPYSHQPPLRKVAKLLFVGLYMFSFGAFISGLLYLNNMFQNKMILLAYIIAFYIIFIHSIILRSIEPRYIIPAFPFFVTGAIFTIRAAINTFNRIVND